ncbi:isopropylmalate isomerase [Pikeienuella sp. HZG-20]|uniref:isopropylmalate isomerase n=1 Tax=Paludibacillus litoralis TaxID=3133267 RepID=UPI0030ED2928
MKIADLAACVFSTWSPTIGDPTVMGWATVAAYLAAGVLAALVVRGLAGRERVFWLGLTALLLALAVNKQLDLQSALTAAGRCVAKAQGWYGERRPFQVRVIFSIIGASLLAAAALTWTMRRELADMWLALIGLVFLLAFIAIRAAGFHHFDQFLGYEIGGVRMNWLMELGGVAMIALNALHLLLRRLKRREISDFR